LVVAILIIMAIWALLFYAVIMDEVYDNIDDGLKNQKILIIREAYINSEIIENARDFGINQFRILPVEESTYTDSNQFSKEMIYMPYDEDDEPYRVLRTGFHDQEGNPYKLEIRTSTVEEDDFLFDLGISLAVLYSVIVLSIMVINYLVLTRAWRPFHQILNNLSRYRFGNAKSFQAVPTQVAEFHELNQQIQVMISTNEEVFSSQKRFIENASHELQTPLTIMASKLDLLMQDSTLGENQLVKISEARQSLLRMANLNKSLLMLSRIENKQYMDAEDVNFNEIIKELIEELDYLVEQRGVHVDYEEDGVFMTQCNKELALVLFSNLLRNAIKHNIEIGGRIIIKISASEIRIANSGAAALNPKYIFERFHKGRQDSQSNGLGLSIVRSILQQYPDLTLVYGFVSGMHEFKLLKK
jgi:signal transduction histidine kinase